MTEQICFAKGEFDTLFMLQSILYFTGKATGHTGHTLAQEWTGREKRERLGKKIITIACTLAERSYV